MSETLREQMETIIQRRDLIVQERTNITAFRKSAEERAARLQAEMKLVEDMRATADQREAALKDHITIHAASVAELTQTLGDLSGDTAPAKPAVPVVDTQTEPEVIVVGQPQAK